MSTNYKLTNISGNIEIV